METSMHGKNRRPLLSAAAGVLTLLLLATGCGSVEKDKLTNGLKSATSGYQSALRWGYYENAYAYVDPKLREDKPLPSNLEGLKLTGYDVFQPARIAKEEKVATQMVTIEYLHEDNQVVKKLTDRQLWRWDEEEKKWWLESGLPNFE